MWIFPFFQLPRNNPCTSWISGLKIFLNLFINVKSEFVRIDHDFTVDWAARYLKDNTSSTHYLVVTAPESFTSSFLLYTQTKRRIEQDIVKLGFDKVSIFRPAFLIGRPSGGRIAETMFQPLVRGLEWLKPHSVGVDVSVVAKSMVRFISILCNC